MEEDFQVLVREQQLWMIPPIFFNINLESNVDQSYNTLTYDDFYVKGQT